MTRRPIAIATIGQMFSDIPCKYRPPRQGLNRKTLDLLELRIRRFEIADMSRVISGDRF